MPGDILVGDRDGIAVIRPEDAPEILREVKKKFALEEKTIADYTSGCANFDKHEELYRSKMEKGDYLYIKEGE